MEKSKLFIISGANDILWNMHDFVDYLAKNQHGHISMRVNPEATSLKELGVYKLLDSFEFSQVDIYTDNPLETHDKYNIINPWANNWLEHQPVIDTSLHNWNQKKTFLAFFHRPTANRLGLAAYLHRHYPEQSHIHFPYETDIDRIEFFEFDKLAQYRTESLGDVAEMLPHMPLRVFDNTSLHEIRVNFNYEYNDDPGITMYQDVLIDIIGETHASGKTFYPTEKLARPMWLKKPFIAFASGAFLDYLHQLGFKTFSDYWSEEYDGFEDRDRFLKMLQLIDDLAKKPKEELYKMYQDMQPILEHNFELLKNQTYKRKVTYIS